MTEPLQFNIRCRITGDETLATRSLIVFVGAMLGFAFAGQIGFGGIDQVIMVGVKLVELL